MSNCEFKSVFRNEFQDLLEIKRALGFKYEGTEGAFHRLDDFFFKNNVNDKCITKELADIWCKKRSYESINNHAKRVHSLRVFCTYLDEIGIMAYIPSKGITRKGPRYDAHIYTDDELKRFFKAVDNSRSVPSECPYRADVMPIFFRILYTSGMRVSELRLAKNKDINLEEGYITVRNGKNHKDRIVPIHPSLVQKCVDLKEKIHKDSDEDEFFFMKRPGQPMSLGNVYRNFRRYLEKSGISHTGKGPRVHDFRWTFCVNLLRKWTDEGKDLIAWMPYMRTMLGHESFEETSYYLKLTAERYSYIRNQLKKSFPNLIEEVSPDEKEFY